MVMELIPGARYRKGVSPLIAAVLLIAFTMAVAAILTAWVTTFTTEQTGAVSNQSEQVIECSYAGLSVYDAFYDSGDDSIAVTIANTGTVDLNNIQVYALANGRIEGNATLDQLSSGSLGPAEITNYPSETTGLSGTAPDRVRITTKDCSSVTAEETDLS